MSNYQRGAIKSDEYVSRIQSESMKKHGGKLSDKEKSHKLSLLLNSDNQGLTKIGQLMIGPIQLKLRYQGLVRNVLIEDPVEPGIIPQYDVMNELGQAYVLHGTEGEVKITQFEGKIVQANFFRIASYPRVRKDDLYALRSSVIEFAQDQSRQAIQKQEDSRLVMLLEAAVVQASGQDTYGNSHVVNAPAGYLTPNVLYDAVTITDQMELESGRMLFNPKDYRDLYRFDVNQTGWAMKDRVVAGEKITSFGEFQIGRSVIIPAKTIYLTPAPEFLGVMPVRYSLDVEEWNNAPEFQKGWVMDELLSMLILNSNGIVKIVKP